MTTEQLDHYMKGGYFIAKYSPKVTYDLSTDDQKLIGNDIKVYQNCLNHPTPNPAYPDQFAFSSSSIYGWFPEEDIEILQPIEEYLEFPEPIVQYMYKMKHISEEGILRNFGLRSTVPIIVMRSYTNDKDQYVLNELSDPPADEVYKAVWDYRDTGIIVNWEELK